ncbi:MAG: hypothetical protein G5Z42_03785 [Caldisphaeraceae archaeon]|nr:hypothetical protein [Caldisphaeraceae archaeon]MEB3692144.1 hypothetical protein [Caldisphaeraceae archaeon]MEB3797927.1 hypothetical protein [Caldisphaeraceae archaeon]
MRGEVTAILSSERINKLKVATRIDLSEEKDDLSILYKKDGDYIKSFLIPKKYPSSIINVVKASTLSNKVVVIPKNKMDWIDGELLLIANSSDSKACVVDSKNSEIKKLITASKLNIEVSEYGEHCIEAIENTDKGFIYIDRVFTVKGIGTIMLGFTFTKVERHDKLIALPSMKTVEVKNIQVLDENQQSVEPKVRIGIALKGIKAEEVKGTYALIPVGKETLKKIEGSFVKYPWNEVKQGKTYHLISNGIVVTGKVKHHSNNKLDLELSKPLPKLNRLLIVDVNLPLGKPRILGYVQLDNI